MGVFPPMLSLFIFTPCLIKIFTVPKFCSKTMESHHPYLLYVHLLCIQLKFLLYIPYLLAPAVNKEVSPFLSSLFISAPCFIKHLTIFSFPFLHAMPNGVSSFMVSLLMSAPLIF